MSAEQLSPSALGDLTAPYPPPLDVEAVDVRAQRPTDTSRLVVLDDDPTGTQSVADLPVLTSWTEEDLSWALSTGAPAVYVMTNARSLAPSTAAHRNREVATNALRAATALGREVDFASRSDSTLRGHHPLETDVLTATIAELTSHGIDGVVIVPAFGRTTGRPVVGRHVPRT